ncbi:hypothetical protein K1T71_014451 [Dendrolimus kikuchii]|uniref:Uncharacterized protein n=1 Tax=Dendrolimus kikuchii TaxID=765133 RepID=A0ACC1CE31_9NEOP|nr:hypothetical protein K1T71_014451 [Dendrolimus kikuchii]
MQDIWSECQEYPAECDEDVSSSRRLQVEQQAEETRRDTLDQLRMTTRAPGRPRILRTGSVGRPKKIYQTREVERSVTSTDANEVEDFAGSTEITLKNALKIHGYHILCMFQIPSRSHNNLGKGIVDALLKDGHEVTWATPYPELLKSPINKLHIVDVSATKPLTDAMGASNVVKKKTSMSVVREFAMNISKVIVEVPALRDVIVKTQFDAVISEWFFSDVDCGYAAVQQVPWILLSGTILMPNLEKLMDDIRSISTIPVIFNDYPIPMNFWQRLVNTFTYMTLEVVNWMYHGTSAEIYQSSFGPLAAARGVTLPPYDEALYNVSVLLVNSHPSFAPSLTAPKNVFDVAGYHIAEEVPPLPKDLQDILDKSPQGVVYFSMGSVLKSASFPANTKNELIKIFGNLPYTVLWKFEEKMENLPKNLHIRSWMPQASILAHPNVKVFITHGGLLSALEALNFGIPCITIPIFGDQPANAARAVRLEYALKIDFGDDLAKDIKLALDEMLNNDRYYEKAKYLSKLFRDRPVSPSKLVTYAIRTAIESNGAYHLRSKAHLYSWYERWMLDQVALVLAVLVILLIIIKKVASSIFRNKIKATKEYKLKKK